MFRSSNGSWGIKVVRFFIVVLLFEFGRVAGVDVVCVNFNKFRRMSNVYSKHMCMLNKGSVVVGLTICCRMRGVLYLRIVC